MGKYPVLKPLEVVAILGKLGFIEARHRGSHKQYRHPDGRSTTVPFHKGRDYLIDSAPADSQRPWTFHGRVAEIQVISKFPHNEYADRYAEQTI